jgi:hypothetical protein
MTEEEIVVSEQYYVVEDSDLEFGDDGLQVATISLSLIHPVSCEEEEIKITVSDADTFAGIPLNMLRPGQVVRANFQLSSYTTEQIVNEFIRREREILGDDLSPST